MDVAQDEDNARKTMHSHLKDDTNMRLLKGNFGMKEL